MKKFFIFFSVLVFAIVLVGCKKAATPLTITYNLDGGVNASSNVATFTKDDTVTLTAPTKEGYTFLGWYDNTGFTGDPITSIPAGTESNISLYALWQANDSADTEYSVAYVLNGGENDSSNVDSYVASDLPIILGVPTKVGYGFAGWYSSASFSGAQITSIASGSMGNLTLYAKWELVYNVTYHLDGGDNATCNPPTFTESNLDVYLEVATKQGYTFDGWYDNSSFTGSAVSFITTVGDKTLYAKFTENTYTLNYDLDGGVNSSSNLATIGYSQFPYTLEPATKADYKFAGWYDNASFSGTKISSLEALSSDSITLYAKFEEIHYITYVLNDGVNDSANLTEYSESDLPLSLAKAAKLGQVFNGWYTDAAFTSAVVKSIITLSETPITLYAKFTPASLAAGEYAISYIMNGGNMKYDTIEELADEFLFDFYTYLGLTSDFEAFKAVGGNYTLGGWYVDTTFQKLFSPNQKLPDNSNFFINQVEYNQKWLAFFDVLDVEITKVNPAQTFWGGYFVSRVRMGELFNKTRWATTDSIKYFNGVPVVKYTNTGSAVNLTSPVKPGFVFAGWYDNPEFTGEGLLALPAGSTGNKILYAKWGDAVLPTEIAISNPVSELEGYEEYQLNVNITPSDTFDKRLIFESSDENVATISQDGLLSTKKLGTTTITITSVADSSVKTTMTLTVINVDRVEIRTTGHGTIKVGETIQLQATVYPTTASAIWSSEDTAIATVSSSGLVTGVAEGAATIKVVSSVDSEIQMTIEVTVLPNYTQADALLEYLISAHEGTVLYKNTKVTGYQFVYYTDLYGSVSKYWFGENIITERIAPLTNENRPGTLMTSVEYITVHDTASSASTADALMHANYVYNGGGGTSWHYSSGDTGIYHQIPDNEVAYHAGDGSLAYELFDTGIAATTPTPTITISTDGYWVFNGSKSTMLAPTNNGVILPTSKITPAGIHTVVGTNGNYYIGKTWYSASYGYIGNGGGNRNSIGIESMVNQGSDLYLTWQKLAKLVAKLLIENDLDTSRVKPHNFFSGKNCPQTMRDNSLLQNFYDLVEVEYNIAKNFSDYTITFTSNSPQLLSNTGRIISAPRYSTVVSYTITVAKDSYSKSVTLYSVVPGQWNW